MAPRTLDEPTGPMKALGLASVKDSKGLKFYRGLKLKGPVTALVGF